MKERWIGGNQAVLLENGEAFFPAVFEAIRNARREVVLETFILFEDKVGHELHAALMTALANGASVDVMVDGYGSADLTAAFVRPLTEAGARVRSFDPGRRVFGQRTNVLRRMHRKIVVVDGVRAFVGGINYSADHLADFGPEAKQDYAVELQGPIVAEIRRFALDAISADDTAPTRLTAPPATSAGTVDAIFATRDNINHRNDIERHYRAALRTARRRVVIANAYFFPGYRLLRELRRAARRGVQVDLILQGEPDMPIVKFAAELLYQPLTRAGVRIHEYCRRPLHGKVAVVDDDWSTVGSSNLDPLSLSLNLEANVILRDAAFADQLRGRLQHLIDRECRAIAPQPEPIPWWDAWISLRNLVVFHLMRRFPVWASLLPRHRPTLTSPLIVEETGATAVEPVAQGEAGMIDRLRAHWPLIRRVGIIAFFALVLWLIVGRAREIEWDSVLQSMRAYPLGVLLTAAALSAASYAVYCSYDLIARRVIGHPLTVPQVLRVGFVSYAFNLNLGSLVGGFAVRYRLYGRLGLEVGTVTRILGLGLITNWLGYLALAGAVFLIHPLALPAGWEIGSTGLRVLGAAMLAVAAGYLALCLFARQRTWHLRGHAIELPGGRIALLQLGLSVLNWALMAGVVWVLLRQRVDPATVLAVLMIAAVAGVIAHVPAGLGVLEGVFLALLAQQASHGDILAALLCYRAIYYLAPLCAAAPLYFWMEARARGSEANGSARERPASMSSA